MSFAGGADPPGTPVDTRPTTIIRTYRGHQQGDTASAFAADAAELARIGYSPTSQSWAQGQWGCGAFLLALLLCFVLLGIFIFIYMLIVKPEGTLTVTYSMSAATAKANELTDRLTKPADPTGVETRTCPRCAEDVRALATACRFCGYEFPPLDPAQLGRYRVLEAIGPTFVMGEQVDLGRHGMSVVLSVAGRSYWLVPAGETVVTLTKDGFSLSRGSERVTLQRIEGPPLALVAKSLRAEDAPPR